MSEVAVRPSQSEGLGMFATRSFHAGARIRRMNVVREVTPDSPILLCWRNGLCAGAATASKGLIVSLERSRAHSVGRKEVCAVGDMDNHCGMPAPGSAIALFFLAGQGGRYSMREILRFLSAP
jgi:hypothetical protein